MSFESNKLTHPACVGARHDHNYTRDIRQALSDRNVRYHRYIIRNDICNIAKCSLATKNVWNQKPNIEPILRRIVR